MTLLVDTSVWSLAFRRDGEQRAPPVIALRAALEGGDSIFITGIILQELLQGFSGPKARKELLEKFAALPMLVPDLIEPTPHHARERRAHLAADAQDQQIAVQSL